MHLFVIWVRSSSPGRGVTGAPASGLSSGISHLISSKEHHGAEERVEGKLRSLSLAKVKRSQVLGMAQPTLPLETGGCQGKGGTGASGTPLSAGCSVVPAWSHKSQHDEFQHY